MSVLRFLTIKGASASFRGHVVFFQVVWSIPMFLIETAFDYRERTLTMGGEIWSAFVAVGAGFFMAFVAWHVVTVPILKRRGKL
jgi:hypothetical protein